MRQATLQTTNQNGTSTAQVDANRALLQTAELNLEYATIRAPICGRVGDSLIQVGGLVTKTSATPLTTIVPLDPIWVRFKVSEAEYLNHVGQNGRNAAKTKLSLLLADNSEYGSEGHIQNTVNQVDPKTGTLELQATFPNPQHIAAGAVWPGPLHTERAQRRAAGSAARGAGTAGPADPSTPWSQDNKVVVRERRDRRSHRQSMDHSTGLEARRPGDRRRHHEGAARCSGDALSLTADTTARSK